MKQNRCTAENILRESKNSSYHESDILKPNQYACDEVRELCAGVQLENYVTIKCYLQASEMRVSMRHAARPDTPSQFGTRGEEANIRNIIEKVLLFQKHSQFQLSPKAPHSILTRS